MAPQKTPIEIVFEAPDHALMAAADELSMLLNAAFQKIYKERKLDGRVSLSVARAVTAAMYRTMSASEQSHSQECSRKLLKRLNFLVIPGGGVVQ